MNILKNLQQQVQREVDQVVQSENDLKSKVNRIQKQFEREQAINEKRILFIQNSHKSPQASEILRIKSLSHLRPGVKLKLSQKKEMQKSLFQNKDILGIYNLLNKKLYQLADVQEGLDELKDQGKMNLQSSLTDFKQKGSRKK